MEDNNIPQGPQDQNLGQPEGTPQSLNQSSVENTYWESQSQDTVEQSPNVSNQSAPETMTGDTPVQQTSSPQTQEQFYSYYQQQMSTAQPGSQQPYQNTEQTQYTQAGYQQGSFTQKPKKKSRGKLIAAIVVILILVSGAATAFAFKDKIVNVFSQMTKSPAEYYAYVEEKAIKESTDELKEYANTAVKDMAVDLTTDVTLNRETLDTLLQSSLGVSLADMEGSIGVTLESFGLNVQAAKKGNKLSETFGVRFNEVDLITMDMFMDLTEQEMLMRFPELSDAYVDFSSALEEGLSEFDLDELEAFAAGSSIDAADLLKRYGNIIIKNIEDVEMDKNAEITIDDLSVKCTKLTVTISNDDVKNMLEDILSEAKEDKYILDVLDLYGIDEDDYQDMIDQLEDDLEDSSEDLLEEDIEMLVYVDGDGNIIGREFSMDGSDASIGYITATKGSETEYKLYVNDDDDNEVINLIGSHTKKNGVYNGSAKLNLSDPYEEYFTTISLDIDYEDVKSEKKNNHTYHYGTITLSSLDLFGIQVEIENSVKDNVQKNKIEFQMGSSPIVTINSKLEYLTDIEVDEPSDSDEVYDIEDIDSYTDSLDLEGYLSNISEKLGIDLQSLLDYYYYDGYDY